jgi:hypothetical protein
MKKENKADMNNKYYDKIMEVSIMLDELGYQELVSDIWKNEHSKSPNFKEWFDKREKKNEKTKR